MSNLAKLKKKAAEFEQKRQFDKALATYEEVLRAQEGSEDADVSLYNRVGDLQLRLGRGADALNGYERAVDLYTERGFLNNAIALCNKILRQSPGAAHIHYKLGRVNALKGFKSDARQHFLTYAELMQRGGRLDEAFTALKEFADLSPGQEDLRLLLADQFARHERLDEAMAQLQIVLDCFQAERRHAEAQIVRERMRALDPDYVSEHESHSDEAFDEYRGANGAGRTSGSSAMPELVLIDPAEYGARSSGAAARPGQPQRAAAAPMPADDPTGPLLSRPSGSIAMPEGIIRGADADLTEAPTGADAFGTSPFGLDDLHAMPPERPVAADVGADVGFGDLVLTHGAGHHDALDASHAAAEPLALDDPLGVLDEPRASGGFELLDVSTPEAEPTGAADHDDVLLIVDGSFASDGETDRAALASAPPDGIDTAALGAALEQGWSEAGALEIEAAAVGAGSADDGLAIVLPEGGPASEGTPENPIAGFDSWLSSPASLAAPAAATAQPSDPADADAVAPAASPVRSQETPVARTPVVRPPMVSAADGAARSVMPAPVAVRPEPKTPVATRPVAEPERSASADSGFINLGDMLREEELPRSTRMVVEERAPTGDEEADFAAMLRKFKQGVAENVDDEDYDSHYDLGVAYKEMGLTEEAIAEFQRALRGTERRARTYEALGQCFLDLGQAAVATSLLQRAMQEPGMDDQQLVGVLYLLGRAAEMLHQGGDAVRYYERVLAVDITFSDVSDRIGSLEQVAR